MEVPKRAKMREILLAFRALLVKPAFIHSDRIFIVARNVGKLPDMHAPNDLLIRPRGFQVNQNTVAAAGRYVTPLTRIIDVIVRTRRELDQVGSDIKWLTDETNGYFDIEEAAFSAVQVQIDSDGTLLDSAGNSLLMEPMRVVEGTIPEKDITGTTPGWGNGAFGVEVKYLANLDITIQ